MNYTILCCHYHESYIWITLKPSWINAVIGSWDPYYNMIGRDFHQIGFILYTIFWATSKLVTPFWWHSEVTKIITPSTTPETSWPKLVINVFCLQHHYIDDNYMLVTMFRCWRQNLYAGVFFSRLRSDHHHLQPVANISKLSPK